MFFARSSLSILLAIIAFFTLALSVSAHPVPNMVAGHAAPGTLLGRTYSRKPVVESVMISRSPADVLDDEPVELLSRDERFHRRTQTIQRNIARHAAAASVKMLKRRAPEPEANTIHLVAKREV